MPGPTTYVAGPGIARSHSSARKNTHLGTPELTPRQGLTASTAQSAPSRTRWATLPMISLPTGERRRRPDHDQARRCVLGHREHLVGDVGAHRLPYLDLDVGSASQRRGHAAQLLVVGEAVVDQRVAAGGVDHHDADPRGAGPPPRRGPPRPAVLVGRPGHHDPAHRRSRSFSSSSTESSGAGPRRTRGRRGTGGTHDAIRRSVQDVDHDRQRLVNSPDRSPPEMVSASRSLVSMSGPRITPRISGSTGSAKRRIITPEQAEDQQQEEVERLAGWSAYAPRRGEEQDAGVELRAAGCAAASPTAAPAAG